MVVLDIETIAIDGAAALVEPVSAPANYKKAEAIAAYIEDAMKAQIEKAALYAYTARIVALGWCEPGDEVAHVEIANSEAAEHDMLAGFLRRVVDERTGAVQPLVTFNGRSFDLPVLMVRSGLLGVRCPALNIDRYRSPHPDLMQLLTFNGVLPARSLTWFAKRFGLNTDDAFSGREIAQLYADENWDAIKSHCASDVILCRQLAERIGLMKPLVRGMVPA